MNDDEKELLKTGMEVALRPVTDVAENAIGLLGGDWLSETRRRNRERLKAKTDELLRQRKVEKPIEPSPAIVLPLLGYAQDESRDELLDLWAKLLAAAADPNRSKSYRREFAEIVKQLEPLDAAVLPILAPSGPLQPSRQGYVASKLAAPADQVEISFRNLTKLELVFEPGSAIQSYPIATALGRELLALVS